MMCPTRADAPFKKKLDLGFFQVSGHPVSVVGGVIMWKR